MSYKGIPTVKRRKLLKSIGATSLAGLAGCTEGGGGGASDSGSGKKKILLKTAGGSPGGTGYAIMNAVLSGVSAEYPNISYNILPGGWVGNNVRLQKKEIDLGHTTLAAGTLASNLEEPYDKYKGKWKKPPANIRSLLADQSELFFFVVAQPDFKYDTLTQAAKDDYAINVTNQPKGTFGGFLWDSVLRKLDYSQKKIQKLGGSYRRVGWNDAAQLFSDGQVDAILAVGGRDLGWLNGIAANKDVKYLNWNEEFRQSIMKNYGVLKADLDDVFPKQSGTLKCTQDSGLINTHKDVDKEAVYKVTKGIIKKQKQIQESSGLLKPFKANKEMVKPAPFDIHAGAKKAYKEEGIL